MKLEKPLVTARAKIMWGDDPETVRAYLIEHGLSYFEANYHLEQFIAERHRTIRRRGIRNVIVGVCIMIATSFFIPLLYAILQPDVEMTTRAKRGVFHLVGIAFLFFLYGVWKTCDGIFMIAKPSGEKRCLTVVNEE